MYIFITAHFFVRGEKNILNDRPCVLLQVGELPKTFLTVGTAVGFDTKVYAQVLGQVGCVCEGLSAVRTLVSLRLCVCFRVNLHV